jgi:hypothetical protein
VGYLRLIADASLVPDGLARDAGYPQYERIQRGLSARRGRPPDLMMREGQAFSALATLTVSDPRNFYIGRFEPMDDDDRLSYAEAIGQITRPTDEFRF